MKKFILCVVAGYLFIFILFMVMAQINARRRTDLAEHHAARSNAVKPQGLPAPQSFPENALPPLQKKPELEKLKGSGPIETFYKNGRLSSEWVLDEKTASGTLRTYFSEGAPWQEAPFQGGQPAGVWKTYTEQGRLFSEENFEAGERQGGMTFYYETGAALARFEFRANVLNGDPSLLSEDGSQAKAPAVNTPTGGAGYFKAYDAQGHEYVHWQQTAGEAQTQLKTYYATGSVSADWIFNNKSQEGTLSLYSPQGQRQAELLLRAGALAKRRIYNSAGNLIAETVMQTDLVQEESQGFYPHGEVLWMLTKATLGNGNAVFSLKTLWEEAHASQGNKKLL